jgi:hypothetical protein
MDRIFERRRDERFGREERSQGRRGEEEKGKRGNLTEQAASGGALAHFEAKMAGKGQMLQGWRSRAAATMAILFFMAAMIQTCSSRSATPAAEFEAWGESLREKFQDDQPHAVDAALAARE